MSSTGTGAVVSCSATSATTAAAASGCCCGGEGGAFTGVVDSGVSNASSESELLVEIKREMSEQSKGLGQQAVRGKAEL